MISQVETISVTFTLKDITGIKIYLFCRESSRERTPPNRSGNTSNRKRDKSCSNCYGKMFDFLGFSCLKRYLNIVSLIANETYNGLLDLETKSASS